ncbi:uncharacterized protein LOC133737455 [Rosa rugosa]|uniref:uncharacterized protein LOC133737455 n=1 Tax=Rosa rugosa TaxID=74645 RepID=UPI002B4068A6|nr:uncharacterized protein LOC133737455 [Rosa rugosa]
MRYPLDINDCYSIDILDDLAQKMFEAMNEDTLATTLEQGVGYTKGGAIISKEELKDTCEGKIIENVSFLEASPYVGKSNSPLSIQLSTNKTLPSVVQAPELELKPLPDHLKYVYLGDKETLPVIVSSALTTPQEEKLVNLG